MLAVVRVLSTSFVAVPALSRVEPASTSAPGPGAMTTMAPNARAVRPRSTAGLHATSTVPAPRRRASARAAAANGVTPLAETPTTTSPRLTRARTARRAARASSSAPSRDRKTAPRPPAMIAWTSPGRVPKVGGHSAASRTPRRPLVPAPTKTSLPPRRSASTISSTAAARSRRTRPTAATARRSSRFMRPAISSAESRSSARLARFTRSVGSRS